MVRAHFRIVALGCVALVALLACGETPGDSQHDDDAGSAGDAPGGSGSVTGGASSGGSGGTDTGGNGAFAGKGGTSPGGASGSLAGYPNTGDVPGSTCAAASAKLAECELATGEVDCSEPSPDPNAPCRYGCYELASCSDVEEALCSGAPNRFASCLARCIEFRCEDGTPLLSSWWCDGLEDCAGGEDELDCPPPAHCNDGSGLAPAWICDGFPDCPDAEDELDCEFSCGSGETIARDAVCDTTPDCADRSDELNCVELTCDAKRVRL